MCLSTLYVDDATEPVGKNICKLYTENGAVIASDIMGREIRLIGRIENLDLIENTVRVRTAAAN